MLMSVLNYVNDLEVNGCGVLWIIDDSERKLARSILLPFMHI